MDDNTLLLSEILQELRTLNHNITIIYTMKVLPICFEGF